ncbi:MAG: 30S ribosomal protein S11 [Candidatus Vogelbacteria bacterium]|nr:30S ribosomal protein S11 [Candidatus Vogelbacteria bacterium]
MGKKRVVAQSGITAVVEPGVSRRAPSTRRKLASGRIQIQATYNNTKLALYDLAGNLILWVTSGGLGFAGAKKGTTFAAGKVGERLADQALDLGLKEAAVVIKGVGAGREAALRAFSAKGINITSITDATPIPFNGPRPRRPRRV